MCNSASVISIALVFCVQSLSTIGVHFKLCRCTVYIMDSSYLKNTQDAWWLHQKMSKTFTAIKVRQARHYEQREHYIKCSLHKKWQLCVIKHSYMEQTWYSEISTLHVHASFSYIFFWSLHINHTYVRCINPQSVILLCQPFRILGYEPQYSQKDT